jgi:hypothetical protein
MRELISILGRVLLIASLAGALVACGDDDDDDAMGDGDGDSAGTGGGDGDAAGLTKAQCLEMAEQDVHPDCLDCTCEADPDATAACGADCWLLLACVAENCAESEDDNCIVDNCADWASGAGSAEAMVLGPAVMTCGDLCAQVVME